MSEHVVITNDLIAAGMTGNGGWTRIQLALIGVSWPPPKGWRRRAIGRRIPKDDAERFVAIGRERRNQRDPPSLI
jgi:hypothetical protein